MALDLHDVLVGVISLIDEHVARGSSDCNQVISLFVPGELADTGLGDAGALVLADGLIALEPAFVLQFELKNLDGWIAARVQSLPPVAK